ncbi:hypothetical protein K491DRAFT_694703 [Lophiostoma macrostomum CBS 122681]|uniref:DUF1772-domain-containing protein n=1 Tax=Lophiostoma macrostomum CBS 122681 TaxID=1314788 RepID=A0A6A6T058_9PLEO|nr:hypothetical protein K491DRAFT_694703 [Lophiostoma macrostomum CBS 122681]
MATTQIVNLTLTLTPPALVALRLAPLLGSSCSLVHAWCELITTSAFLNAPPIGNKLSVLMAGHGHTPSSSSSSSPPTTAKDPGNAKAKEVKEAEEAHAKSILIPIWMANFFNRGAWSVIALNSVTLYSALANLYLFPEGLGEFRTVFGLGTAAAVAHYAFVPAVAPSVGALYRLCVRQQMGAEVGGKGTETGKSAEEWIREWHGVHRVRMFSVDLVAWGCFAWGVVGVLSRGL